MITKHQTSYANNPAGHSLKGFTLIELLIVLGIILVLIASIGMAYGNFQVSAQLNESASHIVQTLRVARIRSIARVNNFAHGVYFEINVGGDDKFILYQGSSYATRQSEYDRVITLSSSLSLLTALSGTGDSDDINFSRGLGVPNKTGTITLTHDVSGSRSISINRFGVIEEN